MLRVALKLLLAFAALAAIFAFVPFGGRTLSDRYKASPSPKAFVERTWAEMKGVPAPGEKPAAKARPLARSGARGAQQPATRDRAAERPSESHTDSDRRAVDRIVSEHLSESR